jgi:hypothetical protein
MFDIREDAQGGVNTFIETQKALPDDGAVLTLVEFDDRYDIVYDGDLSAAPEYVLSPRGSTALMDAIGKTLSTVKKKAKKKDKVVVSIVTDGHENASVDWNKERIHKLMKECRELGWAFDFMVADEKAMDDARSWGFAANSLHSYKADSAGITRGYSNLAQASTLYRSNGTDADTNAVWDDVKINTKVKTS